MSSHWPAVPIKPMAKSTSHSIGVGHCQVRMSGTIIIPPGIRSRVRLSGRFIGYRSRIAKRPPLCIIASVSTPYTTVYADCQKQAQTTQESAACLQAEFARQDAALNLAWKAALARLPAATHTPLLKAQRKWIAARDPFCQAESDGGGTIAPVEYVDCRVELTIRRTMWLENLH